MSKEQKALDSGRRFLAHHGVRPTDRDSTKVSEITSANPSETLNVLLNKTSDVPINKARGGD